MGVMSDLFPEVDWLSLPTPGDSLGQQPAANPAPAISIPEGTTLPPEFQQDSSNLQLNWDEWDQVMRDFQMDMQDVQPTNPMGNIPNNVSGWFT